MTRNMWFIDCWVYNVWHLFLLPLGGVWSRDIRLHCCCWALTLNWQAITNVSPNCQVHIIFIIAAHRAESISCAQVEWNEMSNTIRRSIGIISPRSISWGLVCCDCYHQSACRLHSVRDRQGRERKRKKENGETNWWRWCSSCSLFQVWRCGWFATNVLFPKDHHPGTRASSTRGRSCLSFLSFMHSL